MIKKGYRFVVDLNKENKIVESAISSIYLVDYIFIKKQNLTMNKVLNSLSEDIKLKFINDDVNSKIKQDGGM